MKVLRLWAQAEPSPEDTAVCLGFFDGVHLGHQRLIARAREVARARGWWACVHTFDRMPAQVLRPQDAPAELTPAARKERLLAALGVDLLAISRFEDTMRMAPEAFFMDVLVRRLRARHIVAGFDHRFGFRGEGGAETLRTLCAREGIGLDIIQPVRLPDGELVSSSAIRAALAAGDTRRAAKMLGRVYPDAL